MLGLFGVIQTSERLLCDGWLLGVVVGALVFCALLLTTWFCRRVARNPWLRTRFFDDVEFHDDAPASTGQPGAVGRSKSQPE
jgi:hypothetical protein